jgi:NAD(P)-dependent dehydrogenase (short-subunit alcohol dehydrogenase family)
LAASLETVVITGATGALGSAAAAALAGPDRRLVLLGRSAARLGPIAQRATAMGATTEEVIADLSDFDAVRSAAAAIESFDSEISALINTAAMFTNERRLSAQGFEIMLATNHLGPFLLTNLIRPRLARGAVVVTATAPSTSTVDLDALQSAEPLGALRTFGATKAANLLFTFELARRGDGVGVRANAFHPGLLRSGLMRQAALPIRLVTRLISTPPGSAGAALAMVATSPQLAQTGVLFKGTKIIDAPAPSRDMDAQGALWEGSARLVGLQPGEGF